MEYIATILNLIGLGILAWWIWDTNSRLSAVEDLSIVLAETLNSILDSAREAAERELEENNKRVLYPDET